MSFKLKYSVKKDSITPGVMHSLNMISTGSKTDVVIKEHVSEIGIIMCIVYFLTIFYLYLSSIPYLKFPDTMTLSHSLKYSEKIGSIIFLVLFVCLLISLFTIDKGFITPNSSELKKSLVFMSFAMLICFLLMFIITPSKRNNSQMKYHALLAFIILVYIIYSSFSYVLVYKEIYESNEIINILEGISYGILAFGLCMFLLFGVILVGPSRLYGPLSFCIALCEICILLLYGSILSIITTMPKLIDLQLNCEAKVL